MHLFDDDNKNQPFHFRSFEYNSVVFELTQVFKTLFNCPSDWLPQNRKATLD